MAGARSVSNMNPKTLNKYLTDNKGYVDGCTIVWSVAAKIDGPKGFAWIGTGSVDSPKNLKSLIDGNKFPIVQSARFNPHWVIIIGYDGTGTKLTDFYYLDPMDKTAVFRRVGAADKWVTTKSATRIFQ